MERGDFFMRKVLYVFFLSAVVGQFFDFHVLASARKKIAVCKSAVGSVGFAGVPQPSDQLAAIRSRLTSGTWKVLQPSPTPQTSIVRPISVVVYAYLPPDSRGWQVDDSSAKEFSRSFAVDGNQVQWGQPIGSDRSSNLVFRFLLTGSRENLILVLYKNRGRVLRVSRQVLRDPFRFTSSKNVAEVETQPARDIEIGDMSDAMDGPNGTKSMMVYLSKDANEADISQALSSVGFEVQDTHNWQNIGIKVIVGFFNPEQVETLRTIPGIYQVLPNRKIELIRPVEMRTTDFRKVSL